MLIVLVVPLGQRRAWAWAVVVAAAAGLALLQHSAPLPVRPPPPPALFPWLVAWFFARTLHAGRIPLVGRIAAAVEGCAHVELAPALQAYTRGLTRVWALAPGATGVANLVLGLIAAPDGLLVHLGHPPAIRVPQVTWSWFANLLDYGVAALLMAVEYLVRMRLFPDRAYRTLPQFLRRLGSLGPAFWRDVMR